MIARYMVFGPEMMNKTSASPQMQSSPSSHSTLTAYKKHTPLKPYELINLMGGGGVNL